MGNVLDMHDVRSQNFPWQLLMNSPIANVFPLPHMNHTTCILSRQHCATNHNQSSVSCNTYSCADDISLLSKGSLPHHSDRSSPYLLSFVCGNIPCHRSVSFPTEKPYPDCRMHLSNWNTTCVNVRHLKFLSHLIWNPIFLFYLNQAQPNLWISLEWFRLFRLTLEYVSSSHQIQESRATYAVIVMSCYGYAWCQNVGAKLNYTLSGAFPNMIRFRFVTGDPVLISRDSFNIWSLHLLLHSVQGITKETFPGFVKILWLCFPLCLRLAGWAQKKCQQTHQIREGFFSDSMYSFTEHQ